MHRRTILVAAICSLWLLASCETLVTAYLINELLNDKAPAHQWSGTVKDSAGQPVVGIKVEVRATVEGDTDVVDYDDITDENGEYSIKWRWNEDVNYRVVVIKDNVVFAEQYYGSVGSEDQETDFIVQGSVTAQISGMITDWEDEPLEDAVVIAASATGLDATPSILLDGEGNTAYYQTTDSGIYTLDGSVSSYAIVCAYHPDHGFAYAYAQDEDDDGEIALNIQMGEAGEFLVQAQVVDNTSAPVVDQVLPASRQFRLRLKQPWNLSAAVDAVVSDNTLFPGLVGDPSDSHPSTVGITVQSTGANGIADSNEQIAGGVYELELLNVQDDNLATALVTSANPLVLYENSIVIVRVN